MYLVFWWDSSSWDGAIPCIGQSLAPLIQSMPVTMTASKCTFANMSRSESCRECSIPGQLALIHFAARESGKGLKRPPKTMVRWDKAQGDRAHLRQGGQSKAFLWEEAEILRAGRTHRVLEQRHKDSEGAGLTEPRPWSSSRGQNGILKKG